jgi:magnesium transporter
MNFENMPELQAAWGYPFLLVAMVVVAVVMVLYFRRKGWLGGTMLERREADD